MPRSIQVGDAVRVNRCETAPHGYAGTIIELCTGQLDGMVVVRLGQRGKICVGLSELHTCADCAKWGTIRIAGKDYSTYGGYIMPDGE